METQMKSCISAIKLNVEMHTVS